MPTQTAAQPKQTTAQQYRYLCGILLPEIQEVFGIDRETAHKRMREKLIAWGYIKESRSELTYCQTIEITERFKKFLRTYGHRDVVDPIDTTKRGHYAESRVRKTL